MCHPSHPVLRSGCAAIKQTQGVSEWFEPLLQPWRHYVPVASDLTNLSQAVLWLRSHDREAKAMAQSAAELVHGFMGVGALSYYMEELVDGYAKLYRSSSGVPELLGRLANGTGGLASIECLQRTREVVSCRFAPWPQQAASGRAAGKSDRRLPRAGLRRTSMERLARALGRFHPKKVLGC